MSLVEDLRRTALQLAWRFPAFGIAVVHLRYVETTEIPTAAIGVDGRCYWNPEFFASLTPAERIFVLAHEICHLLLMHADRRGGRQVDLWNFANDYAINGGLVAAGVGDRPDVGLFPPTEWEDLSSEQIYDELLRKGVQAPPTPSATNGCGLLGAQGNSKALPGEVTLEEARQHNPKWQQVRAQAKHIGTMSGNEVLEKLFDIPPARVNWRNVVRRGAALAQAAQGYDAVSFAKRGRRSAAVGPQFPGWIGSQARVALCVDSSGSMYNDVPQVLAEAAALSRESEIAVFCVVHDDGVVWEGWFRPNERPERMQKAIARGFGGTCAEEAYRLVERQGRFDVFVHLTDCYLEWPAPPKNCRKIIIGRINSSEPALEGARVFDVQVG